MKILAKSKPDKAAGIAILLLLGLWDAATIDDRVALCERGEVLDTPVGRILFEKIKAMENANPA